MLTDIDMVKDTDRQTDRQTKSTLIKVFFNNIFFLQKRNGQVMILMQVSVLKKNRLREGCEKLKKKITVSIKHKFEFQLNALSLSRLNYREFGRIFHRT